MSRVVVAATSARLLAQAAARDGWQVAAGDLYGDADTCAAADVWWPLGGSHASPAAEIDAGRLLGLLDREASRGAVGWVAGGGFDGRPDLLAAGASVLPLIGSPADAVRRVRDPRWFFDRLRAHGIAHPPVAFDAPASADGWLRKDAASSGGWGVVAADGEAPPRRPTVYWQRAAAGLPMSATFLATGGDVLVLSHNRQWTCRIGDRPYVHAGLVGPVAVAAETARRVARACRALAAEAGVRGLASLDFLLGADGGVEVLELNPRPSAGIAVCAGGSFGEAAVEPSHRPGVFSAHVDASRTTSTLPARWRAPDAVSALCTVYAPRAMALDARHLRLLDAWPDCHDRPAAAQALRPGDPLCSLGASAAATRLPANAQGPSTAEALDTRLDAARRRLLAALDLLETATP